MHELIRSADVLVENYVTGKLAQMGLGYEDCRKINPRLIYTSITGMFDLNMLFYAVAGSVVTELGARYRLWADWSICRTGRL